VKKRIIQLHRRLAVVLWAPFLVWFASGIAMLFGGMPELTEAARLRILEPVAIERIALSPAEAERRAAGAAPTDRISIVTVLGRPAYRFGGARATTVFADTGERLQVLDPAASVGIVASSWRVPKQRVHYVEMLSAPDQWTLGIPRQLPLHHLAVDDGRGSEAYVSPQTGEVALTTDRRTRATAWISAVPHWFYVSALRSRERLWRQVVLWTSALGAITACAGLLVGAAQYRARYTGAARWHYRAGVLFGPFALMWVVSGWLSMQPGDWAPRSHLTPRIVDALSGGAFDSSAFPRFDSARWQSTIQGDIKQIDLVRALGEPCYVIRRAGASPLVVSPRTLTPRAPTDTASISARLRTAIPGVRITRSSELSEYDAYYYDRERRLPLPVARVEFDDPARTIAYIDLATSAVMSDFTRRQRIERWVYHGLHSLDFPVFHNAPLLRTIVAMALCAGGLTLSALGATMAIDRLRRSR
jgi:hypothetical protein